MTVEAATLLALPERGYYKKGDTGEAIKIVQQLLNEKNKGSFIVLAKLKVDGEFGEQTEKHVKLLQDVRHITVDGEVGKKTLAKLQKGEIDLPMQAVNFAVAVARTNKYVYGVGSRAHRGGCPFCDTNTGKKIHKKDGKGEAHYVNAKGKTWKTGDGKKYTYKNTYCCNPFAFSAFAHGAGDAKMLKKCEAGGNATTGMNPKAWEKWGFKIMGKCKSFAYDELKPGDVIMFAKNGKGHVWIYTGSGWLVEASGGTWKASSIAHKKIAKKRYEAYQTISTAYVVRYNKKAKKKTKAEKIVEKATLYAYPKGTDKAKYRREGGKPKNAYRKALEKLFPSLKHQKYEIRTGASCSYFAGVCIRGSGVDKKFKVNNPPIMMDYMEKSSLWKKVNSGIKPLPLSELKPGDIIAYKKPKANGNGHILVYIGDALIAEANFGRYYGHIIRIPKGYLNQTYIKNTYTRFGVYRIKE